MRALAIFLVGASLVLGLPQPSQGATQQVAVRDNRFDPQETRIDPGDTVVWVNQGARVHNVTSDERGQFSSGNMQPGDTYQRRFDEEGYYFYFCSLHGARGQVGMWGVIIVGNPPPLEDGDGDKDARPKLVVPDDFPTIQKAVNAAKPGSTVVIKPGVYKTAVTVQTDR